MKKLIYTSLSIMIAVLIFSACSKDKLTIDIPFKPAPKTFSLDSANIVAAKGEIELYKYSIHLNIDSILSANKAGNIKNVKPSKALLTLLANGQAIDFSWLLSARVTIQSGSEAEQTIASLNPVNPTTLAQSLNISTIDLLTQFNNQDVNIRILGDVKPPLPKSSVELQLAIEYLLTLGLL